MSRFRRSSTRAVVIATALGSAFVLAVVASAFGGQPPGPGPEASPLQDCGKDVPLVKCNASLYSPRPEGSPPTAKAIPVETSTNIIGCSRTFFDETSVAKLVEQFGTLDCFSIAGSERWVVIGDGMSTTAPVEEASPGGAMVAVLACPSDDKACLSPDAEHAFDDFLVSYPPKPSSGRSTLQEIEYDRFLMIANGYCGIFGFDTETFAWYSGAMPGALDSILAGDSVQTATVPKARDGSDALTLSAPEETGGCQPAEDQ